MTNTPNTHTFQAATVYFVVCEDGCRRHHDPFESLPQAEAWAEWGHICTSGHRVVGSAS